MSCVTLNDNTTLQSQKAVSDYLQISRYGILTLHGRAGLKQEIDAVTAFCFFKKGNLFASDRALNNDTTYHLYKLSPNGTCKYFNMTWNNILSTSAIHNTNTVTLTCTFCTQQSGSQQTVISSWDFVTDKTTGLLAQQTQYVESISMVVDVGPTLSQLWFNVLCLLGDTLRRRVAPISIQKPKHAQLRRKSGRRRLCVIFWGSDLRMANRELV